ncbi:MAG: ABC transporter ATP-binding protein [Asgard group archaeon]|nr:ABC transporter ATP-binding protein [Asgard group archaeon]
MSDDINAIEVQELSKHFSIEKKRKSQQQEAKKPISNNQISDGTLRAVDAISFKVKKGEIFDYIGPNGAGKTTTLKILVGLIIDFEGEARINGQSINSYSNLGKILGYLPQDVGFQEWRTVNNLLTTLGLLSGMTREKLEKRIPEVLDLVGLPNSRSRKIKHLSGGMKQKLKLAQALLHNPRILILDEPLSGLDPQSRWQMKQVIRKLAQQDITIIFSSHILREVEDIATSIGIINHGLLIKQGKPRELQEELTIGDAVEIVAKNIKKVQREIKNINDISDVKIHLQKKDCLSVTFHPDSNSDEIIPQLFDYFSQNKIIVRRFSYIEPSLEEVYLKYISGGFNA